MMTFLQDKEPKGIIPLENIQVREVVSEKSNRQNAFELYAVSGSDVIKACKVDSDGKVVEGESCGFTGTAPMRGQSARLFVLLHVILLHVIYPS